MKLVCIALCALVLLAWESGALPVIVLNKADVCADVRGAVAAASSTAAGVPVALLTGRWKIWVPPA